MRFKSKVTRGFSFSPLVFAASRLSRGSLMRRKKSKKNLWDQGTRKTEQRRNYLSAMSALRNTSVFFFFGDSRANFTRRLTVVSFPCTDWLSYLREPSWRHLWAEFVCEARDFFKRLFFRIIFFAWRRHFNTEPPIGHQQKKFEMERKLIRWIITRPGQLI